MIRPNGSDQTNMMNNCGDNMRTGTMKQYCDYVKKDLSVYDKETTMQEFSMYEHSFDGGRSWIGFDNEAE